jgi:multiple sugar transport system substrate-binding protein
MAYLRAVPLACAIAMLALLLCGCAKAQRGPGALRVVFWAGVEELAAEQANVDAFMQAHPGVRVSLESIPDSYLEKLVTAFAAKKPPDVLLLDSVVIPHFVDSGVLLDLEPYLAQEPPLDPRAFFPQAWRVAQRPGASGGSALYALPKDFTPLAVYYNKRVFDAAGVAYPRDGWSWDSFLATAKALTRDTNGDGRTDVYGTLVYTWMGANMPWFWQAGGDVLSPDGRGARGYLDSPACIRAVSFITGLVDAGVAPDPTAREALGGSAFMSGKVGMYVSGHWAIPGFRAAEAESKKAAAQGVQREAFGLSDIGVVGLPRDKARANVIYESGWAVAKDSAQPALAVELAKYLVGPEAQRRRAAIGLALSADKAVAARFAAGDPREAAFLNEVQYCRAPWGTRIAEWSLVESLIGEGLERVLLKYDTPEAAMKSSAKLIDDELNMF